LIRGLLGITDFVDCLTEHVGKTALAQFRRWRDGFRLSHGIHLHGAHIQHQPIELNTLAHDLLSPTTRNFLTLRSGY
jgi:hypothetical protein